MIVKIRDKTYDSVKHASACLGVSKFSIYAALNRGTIDRVGLVSAKGKPILLDGLKFKSMCNASIQLGFNRSFVRWAITSGSQKANERLKQAIVRYKQDMGIAA